ncbi:hypothetical protein BDA99DRAFT_609680 [Phascolomyces articulosus]|uniref:F-box domain-containing protein n=1 Tax=Phascolomyces articulosus TaxID=60185 RepID=A0AAD5P7Q9_9FUNG|nr:hypothetical protein BDA99DRAFT_609680 [Phascolomyces articulosus]
MPIFQQIKNSAYNALPESRFTNKLKTSATRQQEAEKLIDKSPNKVKGYCDLAKVYIEKSNLNEAIKVYDNGIKYISSSITFDSVHRFSSEETAVYDEKKQSLIPTKKEETKNTTMQQKKKRTSQLQWKLWKRANDDDHSNNVTQQKENLLILKKERETVLATLEKHSRQFQQSIPYEILYEIFSYLVEYQDLWQCAHVSKHWCKVMITSPRFWNKISSSKSVSKRSSPAIAITNQDKTYYKVYVKSDYYYRRDLRRNHARIKMRVNDILNILLAVSDDHQIEKLSFCNITFTDKDSSILLGNTFKYIMKSPPLKQVEFMGCRIPSEKSISPVLTSCSELTHITIADSYYPPDGFDAKIGDDSDNQLYALLPAFSALTSLKISLGVSFERQAKNLNSLLFGDNMLFSRCPNLMHLYINCHNSYFDLEACSASALKHCPQLKNLVLGNSGKKMPKNLFLYKNDKNEFKNNEDGAVIRKVHTSINHNATSSGKMVSLSNDTAALFHQSQPLPSTASTSEGLCQFVILCSAQVGLYPYYSFNRDPQRNQVNSWDRCFSTINMYNRDSLELLYIENDIVSIQHLHMWCNYGNAVASNLRELHLHDGQFYYMNELEEIMGPTFDKSNLLSKLFPCLPALEALFIRQSDPRESSKDKAKSRSSHRHKPGDLYVDDNALEQLVKHCCRLRYIKILGYTSYTSKGAFLLAQEEEDKSKNPFSLSSAKLPITHLEMDIPLDILLPLVKKIHSLKELHVCKYKNHRKGELDPIPSDIKQEVEAILHDREGGSLKISSYYL